MASYRSCGHSQLVVTFWAALVARSIGDFDFALAYSAEGNNLAVAVDFGEGDANAYASK